MVYKQKQFCVNNHETSLLLEGIKVLGNVHNADVSEKELILIKILVKRIFVKMDIIWL